MQKFFLALHALACHHKTTLSPRLYAKVFFGLARAGLPP
jgi:hypothetical protein